MTDTCPNCLTPAVPPATTRCDSEQRTDRYRCPRCRHTWVTRRDLVAYRDHQPNAGEPAA
jgi:transposase-like protein